MIEELRIKPTDSIWWPSCPFWSFWDTALVSCHKSSKEITSLNNIARILTLEDFALIRSSWSMVNLCSRTTPTCSVQDTHHGLWIWCELPHNWGSSGIGATTSDPASAPTFHCDFWNGERIMLHCYTKTPNKLFHGMAYSFIPRPKLQNWQLNRQETTKVSCVSWISATTSLKRGSVNIT